MLRDAASQLLSMRAMGVVRPPSPWRAGQSHMEVKGDFAPSFHADCGNRFTLDPSRSGFRRTAFTVPTHMRLPCPGGGGSTLRSSGGGRGECAKRILAPSLHGIALPRRSPPPRTCGPTLSPPGEGEARRRTLWGPRRSVLVQQPSGQFRHGDGWVPASTLLDHEGLDRAPACCARAGGLRAGAGEPE